MDAIAEVCEQSNQCFTNELSSEFSANHHLLVEIESRGQCLFSKLAGNEDSSMS